MPGHVTPLEHHYTTEDFLRFGQRHGIDYRFAQGQRTPVLSGTVEEFSLRSGLGLTHSNVDVLQGYESRSRLSSALFLLVVLEGDVSLRLDQQMTRLTSGMAFITRLTGNRLALNASQPPRQRLRTLNLALPDADTCQAVDPLLSNVLQTSARRPHAWRVPERLCNSLQHGLGEALQDSHRQLLMEGLALQLLAYLPSEAPDTAVTSDRLPPRERCRLEQVRQLLQQRPMDEHRLESLANLAAMSPSSLRGKFRAAYGQSVFDFLRERRLTLAREYLTQGYSVQQTAHRCGYRHASNFTTAFRRHFGILPGSIG